MIRDSRHTRAVVRACNLGYHVDERGQAWSPTNKRVGFKSKGSAYWRIGLPRTSSEGRTRQQIRTHMLVAYQKYGEVALTTDIQVRHLNGNVDDNSPKNIGIGTASENHHDKPPRVRLAAARKAASKTRKLTVDQVLDIRRRRRKGESQKALAEEFGIAPNTLSYVVNRQTYSWVV